MMSFFSSSPAKTQAVELAAVPTPINWRQMLQTAVVLFKLRIVALLLLAATGGAFLGAGGWPGLGPLLLLLVTGGMAAAGASALNQYLERESDRQMGRTRQRPLVVGDIAKPGWILAAGITLVLLPALAVLPFNPALAFFLVLGAIIYVGVYTIWLKPRTLLNIVIGGAAGSAAVMSGGAAVGAWQQPGVLVLALLIFLWTPTHFWSLALLYRNEYHKAQIPMLPAQTSPRTAAFWVSVHTVATGSAALLLGVLPSLGWLYLLPVSLVVGDMLWRNGRLLQRPSPAHARSFFISSNMFLLVLLLMICVSTAAF